MGEAIAYDYEGWGSLMRRRALLGQCRHKRSWLGYLCDFDGKVLAKGAPDPVAERAICCVVALEFVAVDRIQKLAHPAHVAYDVALSWFNCVQRHLKVAAGVGLVKTPGEIDPGKGA